jgi:hypothetical protein
MLRFERRLCGHVMLAKCTGRLLWIHNSLDTFLEAGSFDRFDGKDLFSTKVIVTCCEDSINHEIRLNTYTDTSAPIIGLCDADTVEVCFKSYGCGKGGAWCGAHPQ